MNEITGINIATKVETNDVRGTLNLLNMLHARQYLLNKAIGAEAFRISDGLSEKLNKNKPETIEDLQRAIEEAGDGLEGIRIEDNKITLQFPATEDAKRINAYMLLTAMIAKKSKESRWVNPNERVKTNEKYYFRVWLLQIGMVGDEYKEARKVLMENLNGIASFRTEDGLSASKDRQKKEREAAKAARSTEKADA